MGIKKLNNIKYNSFWDEHELETEMLFEKEIGDLQIKMKRESKELKLTYSYKNLKQSGFTENKWYRWALKGEEAKIRFTPVFPDRPIVVQPENIFKIVKNAEAKIYIRVPLWVRIELTLKKNHTLIEIPTVILSNTWFGNFFDGELCYWISSGVRRQFTIDPQKNYMAICPLKLVNNSNNELSVEKISLRVINLCLYSDGTQLWSDDINIYFTGSMEESEIEANGLAPEESPKSKLIMGPREKHKKTFSAKAFSTLKELPGLGIFTN